MEAYEVGTIANSIIISGTWSNKFAMRKIFPVSNILNQ